MSEQRPSRGMEFFENLRDILTTALADQPGLSSGDINTITRKVERQVVDFWGGLQIYVPRAALQLALRNEQIYRDYTGTNLAELSRKYQLTEISLRKIIHDLRGAHKDPTTAKPLPPSAPEPQPQPDL